MAITVEPVRNTLYLLRQQCAQLAEQVKALPDTQKKAKCLVLLEEASMEAWGIDATLDSLVTEIHRS